MSNYINRSSLSRALECARALSNQTLVRPREAAAILGISRKHLYALANRPDFPKRVRISDRVVAWRVCDIENWIANASDNKQWGVKND
jgi:predicted DNA-binding transcriptional regulator AlpA